MKRRYSIFSAPLVSVRRFFSHREISALVIALFLGLAIVLTPLAAGGRREKPQPQPSAEEIIPSRESLNTSAPREAPSFLEEELPFSRDIRRGTLENGLDFFLKSHSWPEETVVLRLVVDAGSVLEEEDQRGLAHFVEHMAFNGTESFPEGELVAYLESLGRRFGPDINAYTSFDETVYKLELPGKDEDALRQGFQVMKEWASALTFDNDAIDRERGVIVEEWRRGRGAAGRIMDQHIPVIFQGSRYARRLPIGDMEVVRTAPRERLVDFFERWYRPDNMALIVVGDLPLDKLEELTRHYLGSIPAPDTPLERTRHPGPSGEGRRVSIASDAEATANRISLYGLSPHTPQRTVGDYRQALVLNLFSSIMNERLREETRSPDSPLSSGGVGMSSFLHDTEIAVAQAVARNEKVREALEVLVTELERVRRFGFSEGELHRARARMIQGIDNALINADTRESASLADELVRHRTRQEPVPGIDYEHRLYHDLLPEITLEEVSAQVSRFLESPELVLLASLRDDGQGRLPDGSPLPSRDELLHIIDDVKTRPLTPPDKEDRQELLSTTPAEGGKILERRDHPQVETREFLLSNGIRLFVRPSDYRSDEILFAAHSPGGFQKITDPLVTAARLAPAVASESGLGELSASALERALAGRSVRISTDIGLTAERMTGSTRQEDLETLFQLLYLNLASPRFDQAALDTVKQQHLQALRGRDASPQGIFQRQFQELYSAGDPRKAPLTIAKVEAITLEEVQLAHQQWFHDTREIALFFTGSLDPEETARLAADYLGGIAPPGEPHHPVKEEDRAFPSRSFSLPGELIQETVRAGSEEIAQVAILFHNDYSWSQEENHRWNSLGDLLNLRLREVIREEEGGTYGVRATAWRQQLPDPQAFLQISFGMDPERSHDLIQRTLEVLQEVLDEPASESALQRIKAQQRERYRRNQRENSYWLNSLVFSWEQGRDFAAILDLPDLIESLSAEDIQSAARRYIHMDQRLEVLLLPGLVE
ncbi:zinc protease [Alkalispirochaeta americana]|uniref:Zinc protease n=1 Tax=Alkalispirochaeta americana TaxID=159291 RepID=A0A1N6UZQ1_9SPIO|nr:M16 family metallopeptidase [Alkalispirochaeta americana]SIQ71123.1 zinc protease [Alkalispirochaeta americana]